LKPPINFGVTVTSSQGVIAASALAPSRNGLPTQQALEQQDVYTVTGSNLAATLTSAAASLPSATSYAWTSYEYGKSTRSFVQTRRVLAVFGGSRNLAERYVVSAEYVSVNRTINCIVSQWSPFGACSAECGGGLQFRRRNITNAPTSLGTACPVVEESVACNSDACVVTTSVVVEVTLGGVTVDTFQRPSVRSAFLASAADVMGVNASQLVILSVSASTRRRRMLLWEAAPIHTGQDSVRGLGHTRKLTAGVNVQLGVLQPIASTQADALVTTEFVADFEASSGVAVTSVAVTVVSGKFVGDKNSNSVSVVLIVLASVGGVAVIATAAVLVWCLCGKTSKPTSKQGADSTPSAVAMTSLGKSGEPRKEPDSTEVMNPLQRTTVAKTMTA